ncbi:hypothetical protein ACTQ5K_08865 [Niallia sp. Sow4_A1]|uniref:hypothetical protein n=1 Tax=unclassified Niallia TaxID=2837522 RepID=UPI00203EE451|nr:hypothetical protein [Niallia sp. MER TA 168]MCM3364715.1 hypothetical protein [Niallia sp. MER TA 168]
MNSKSIKAINPNVGVPTGSIMLPAIKYISGKREWFAVTLPYTALNHIKTSSVKKKGKEVIKSDIKNRFLDKKLFFASGKYKNMRRKVQRLASSLFFLNSYF